MAFHGDSANKAGQIRAKPIRDALLAMLSREADDPLNDRPQTIAQSLALSLVRDALSEDIRIRTEARSEIIDRTEGKPAQSIIGGDDNDKPLIPKSIEIILRAPGAT